MNEKWDVMKISRNFRGKFHKFVECLRYIFGTTGGGFTNGKCYYVARIKRARGRKNSMFPWNLK